MAAFTSSRPSRGQLAADVALAAGLTALNTSMLVGPPFERSVPSVAWVLAVAHAAPLALRRSHPRTAFATSLGAGVAYLALGYPMVGLTVAGLVAVYSLAAYAGLRDSLMGLAAVEVALAALAIAGQVPGGDTWASNAVGLGAAWLLGDAARRRWSLARLYRERAEELAAAQSELARRAVADERLRIARELHDIVAHSMSVIAVQAGTARLHLGDEDSETRTAIATIEASSRSALDEMRRLLGVLRDGSGDADTAPLPTLADLERLVAQAAADGGTPIDVRIEGERCPLGAGVELAAYRIVQEALTNARRHAPGAPVTLRVRFGPGELAVDVRNDLQPGAPAEPGTGLGLPGMSERAAVYGGTVHAGPHDGTFRVQARLPVGGSR